KPYTFKLFKSFYFTFYPMTYSQVEAQEEAIILFSEDLTGINEIFENIPNDADLPKAESNVAVSTDKSGFGDNSETHKRLAYRNDKNDPNTEYTILMSSWQKASSSYHVPRYIIMPGSELWVDEQGI